MSGGDIDLGFLLHAVVSMRYWWVNQNQTYTAEINGGYIWSPKRNKNGARNQFYENLREVSPGDMIFSFRKQQISDFGIALSNCYQAPKPDEFGSTGSYWENTGWRVDVRYQKLPMPVRPKQHIETIRPHLPDKYSPLQQSGDGLQSVYLASLPKALVEVILEILAEHGNRFPESSVVATDETGVSIRMQVEDQREREVEHLSISETEREAIVKSRRGQGLFRDRVRDYERGCRISGVTDIRFLIASHIKPWRDAENNERVDGENGLLLSPNADRLFDRGFISFDDDGSILISPVVDEAVLKSLGVPDSGTNVGSFTTGQKRYLSFHRKEVFLEAGRSG